MKHHLLICVSFSLISMPALSQTSTGTYCDTDRIVSYYCNGGQPDNTWSSTGNGCYARLTKGQCSTISDRNPVFDYNQYGLLNGDVALNGMDRLEHWRRYGKAEGRPSSYSFFVKEYLDAPGNEDLKAAFGSDWQAALQHYTNYGFHEGRTTRSTDIMSPNWPVFIYNPPSTPTTPQDGTPHFIIARAGNAATNQAITSHIDTSPITGLPNTYRISGRFIGPEQNLIDGQWGFTGIQEYGGQFGIGIDSRTVKDAANSYSRGNKASNPSQDGALVTVALGRSALSKGYWQPWSSGRGGLKTALELRIPFSGGTAGGGSQLNTYYYLHNKITNVGFYFGVALFDTRQGAVANPITVVTDACGSGCSGTNIYIIPIRKNSDYITVPNYSAEVISENFNETRIFEYEISGDNLRSLISYAKLQQPGYNLTDEPSDYEVTSWNLNPEVFSPIDSVGNLTGDGWIGLSGRLLASGPK